VNWDAIGAIGDLVGGMAVVLSLIYVGYQIRQSSRQIELSSRNIEASTYLETGNSFSRWQTLIAADELLADLYLRGLAAEELSQTEALRFSFLLDTLLIAYENNYHQFQIGAVQRDSLEVNGENLKRILGSPGGSRWWTRRAPAMLTPEFRAAVDARLLR
jgi:hypothetical protein